jgi:hypothetical protein
MLARIVSCAVIGLEGVIVEFKVDTTSTLPFMIIVGLPDTAGTCFAALPNSMVVRRSLITNTVVKINHKTIEVNILK